MDILNSEKKLLHILTQLKNSPLPYSVLKTLSGYGTLPYFDHKGKRITQEEFDDRSKNSREFVELLKLGLRLNIIHLNRRARTYCLMKDRDVWYG